MTCGALPWCDHRADTTRADRGTVPGPFAGSRGDSDGRAAAWCGTPGSPNPAATRRILPAPELPRPGPGRAVTSVRTCYRMAADEFVVQLHVRMRRSEARDLLGRHKAAFPHGGALVQDTEVGRMPHAQALRDAPHDFGLGCVGARRIGATSCCCRRGRYLLTRSDELPEPPGGSRPTARGRGLSRAGRRSRRPSPDTPTG